MKKILSFGLMLLMSITAWAGKLYFAPNSNWKQADAKFAAYYFDGTEDPAWTDFLALAEGQTDVYELTIPDGYNKIIFGRFSSAATERGFDKGDTKLWNQTADITLETGKDLFTLADGWDNISGTWSVFTTGETGEGGEEGVETEVASYYLVGNFNSWDIENSPAFTYNEETKTYTISIDRMFGEFKVATTLDWNSQNYGAAQEGDVIALEADYTLQARFDDGNSNLAVSGTYTNAVFRLAQTDKGLVLTFVSGTKEEEVKVDDTTIYFVNTTKATAVNAYVWQADENNTTTIANHKGWPGEAMTKTEAQVNGFDVYSYTFPENFNWVIFITDGDQTTEILRDATKAYYNDGTWYASLEAIPVPETPAKFYIIGDAFLGEGNAWNLEKAIKVTEDSYTMSLAAGTYSMKVLTALNWDAAVGYSVLSEKAEGLTTDDDDNIIFTLAEAGDVVVTYAVADEATTFVVKGNFYVEPVVEPEMVDLRIVPNMWSEADAKIAAWVWGENLAGEWTGFFAGEGDTLSVKVNAEADSIIFVRMNAEAEVPGWEAWNRMANMEIGASMVFTVTDWAAGTWEVYVPETPAKFYIIGDDALLGEGNAWNLEKAIKVTEDSYTMSLAAGTYSMKVLTALNWDAAVGYSALSEKAEGLTTDDTDNIIFTLAEAGDVVVTYAVAEETTTFVVKGNFYVEPVVEPEMVEIRLVPGEWNVADAKFAAWVWGKELSGEWSAFFAGEGDTLSTKINAAADSIVFVRLNSAVDAPKWNNETEQENVWGEIKEEINKTSMIFTVTSYTAGTWDVYVPEVPANFYVIGDAALLGEGNAWNLEKAIKVTEDSYTMSLAAGTYSMKVLTALNWDAAVGYSALSEKAEGLTTDDTDNIIFTLAEAGDVVVTYAVAEETTTFTVSGNFYVEQQPEPKNITIYFVNIYNWTVVNAYVYYEAPAEGVAGRRNVVAQTAMDWPGEAMTKTEEQINGYDVYTYTFTDDNNMFIANNGGSGEGNQTGNIVVDAAKPYIYGEALYATAEDIPAECSGEYGLIVNGTFVAAELNTEAVVDNGAEYMITTTLAVGDVVALYDNCNLAQWVLTPRDDSYSSFTTDTEAQTYTITEAGTYAFYIRIYNGGTSDVYVVYTAGGTTALTEVMNNADKATKVIVNGQLYIVRDCVMYNAQGAVVR